MLAKKIGCDLDRADKIGENGIAIDEAQYLNYNILRDLKMLLKHSYDSLNCFSLVLVGEPYLNYIPDKQVHEALRQRITVHYNYEGLSDQEVLDYICHKLELAGGSRSILEGGALNTVHGYSEGNARKIDNLMTDALTIGARQYVVHFDDIRDEIDKRFTKFRSNNEALGNHGRLHDAQFYLQASFMFFWNSARAKGLYRQRVHWMSTVVLIPGFQS